MSALDGIVRDPHRQTGPLGQDGEGVKIGEWNRAIFEFEEQEPGTSLVFMPSEGLQLRNIYARELK